ncbi:hypothetical protein LIA77_10462 [Sarocladium implicatum]|nr:hypothetical protein LIA77_10462 [Sarocladium implicatum]
MEQAIDDLVTSLARSQKPRAIVKETGWLLTKVEALKAGIERRRWDDCPDLLRWLGLRGGPCSAYPKLHCWATGCSSLKCLMGTVADPNSTSVGGKSLQYR